MVLRWFLVWQPLDLDWFFNGSQPLVKRWNGNDPSLWSIGFQYFLFRKWVKKNLGPRPIKCPFVEVLKWVGCSAELDAVQPFHIFWERSKLEDLLFKSGLEDLLCDFAETYFSSTQQSSRHSTEFPQIWKLLSKFKGRSRKYLIWHKMLMDGWSTLDWSALLIAWLGDSYTWLEEFSKFVELLHLFCNF